MHYIVLDRLSRQSSYLHSVDARFKLAALFLLLIAIATTNPFQPAKALAYLLLLGFGLVLSKLPPGWVLWRAATVLPFTLVFAIVAYWVEGTERSITLISKSYVSAVAVLLIVASTPLPTLMDSAAKLGVPTLIVVVIQFLYRYLFLIVDEGRRMWAAAHLRGAGSGHVSAAARLKAASGTIAVLFARSMQKAEKIHMAMVTRGFRGTVPAMATRPAGLRDALFLGACAGLIGALRLGWR